MTLQLKRASQSTWKNKNPVLAYGEPGYEKETGKLKIGDGVTAWNDLSDIAKESIPHIDGNNITPPLVLMDLEPGSYVLNGPFLPSHNSDAQIEFFSRLVRIDPIDEGKIVVSYQDADGITCIYITNDGYERKWYSLADLGGGALMVTFIMDENKGVTADYTDTEIIEAAKSGIAVYGVCGKDIYTLSQITQGAVNFYCDHSETFHIISMQRTGILYWNISRKVDLKYDGKSEHAQSGKAIAGAISNIYQEVDSRISSKVYIADFLATGKYTEDEYVLFESLSKESCSELAQRVTDGSIVYGVFFDGDYAEFAYPLVIDGGDISFGGEVRAINIDGVEYWTTKYSEFNYFDDRLNTIETNMGNIETALNNIIAIQESLIGGNN